MSEPQNTSWCIYMIRCATGVLYTGITNDIQRRFNEHASQGKKCAKFLRGKGPLELVYMEKTKDRITASQREWAIKQLDKKSKTQLIDSPVNAFTQQRKG